MDPKFLPNVYAWIPRVKCTRGVGLLRIVRDRSFDSNGRGGASRLDYRKAVVSHGIERDFWGAGDQNPTGECGGKHGDESCCRAGVLPT